jgi:phosphoribosyl-ATP pyrophosphohydrolase
VNRPNIDFIAELETIVKARLDEGGDESYTARLAAAGSKRIAQKIGEEGVELALAATAGDQQEVIDEAADLVYHLAAIQSFKETPDELIPLAPGIPDYSGHVRRCICTFFARLWRQP